MERLANSLLNNLLRQGEEHQAGVRRRTPALTERDLGEYRKTTSISNKEGFEAVMKGAQACSAVRLIVDDRLDEHSLIKRIELLNTEALAHYLGTSLQHEAIESAAAALAPRLNAYPVLSELLAEWRRLKAPRSLAPEAVMDLLDAMAVLDYLRRKDFQSSNGIPLRVVSQALFNDTKRLERLAIPLDIFIVGTLDAPARPANEIWQELGLLKEEQPALISGNVVVVRSRVTALLDSPYAAFPAPSVMAVEGKPELVLSIENLTTFHIEARARCNDPVLLLYTAGMPSPVWRAMYRRLLASLPSTTSVFHWGDIDEGGFRIAAKLADEAHEVGHRLLAWPRMNPSSVPSSLQVPARPRTLEWMCRFAEQAGWRELCEPIRQGGFTAEQEALSLGGMT